VPATIGKQQVGQTAPGKIGDLPAESSYDFKPQHQFRLQRHFAGLLEGIFKVARASSFM